MNRTVAVFFYAAILGAMAAGQPQIASNGVLNAASDALIGWPNSSIAQGSIFSIYGSNLGPVSSPAQSYPLQTTLGGVSISVTSGGMTMSALPIFVGPSLINAILPDSAPVGAATIVVVFNGQPSNTVSFEVTANSFGIFTVNSNGTGAGIITDANYHLFSTNTPANPGGTAVIWGTGLGAATGDDGSAPPQPIDMPTLPLTVYVGTKAATVSYRGRSGFTGEDQINFVVPAGIAGCYVPVAVQIGNVVSNFVTMPIAPSGQSCPDPAVPFPNSFTGNIDLTRAIAIGDTTTTTDYGNAYFGNPQIYSYPYVSPLFGNPYSLPVGTCTGGFTFPLLFDVIGTTLDAGPALTVTGPNGSQQLPAPSYSAQFGGGSETNPPPLYLSAGTYTISAPGGTEGEAVLNVGPFVQNFTIPPPLTWTNQSNVTTVERSAGFDVSWTGGDPNGTVQIAGEVQVPGSVLSVVAFVCNAKASDQHFTIPSFATLSVPPSAVSGDLLWLSSTSATPFTAPGISAGTINSIVSIRKTVTYQ